MSLIDYSESSPEQGQWEDVSDSVTVEENGFTCVPVAISWLCVGLCSRRCLQVRKQISEDKPSDWKWKTMWTYDISLAAIVSFASLCCPGSYLLMSWLPDWGVVSQFCFPEWQFQDHSFWAAPLFRLRCPLQWAKFVLISPILILTSSFLGEEVTPPESSSHFLCPKVTWVGRESGRKLYL